MFYFDVESAGVMEPDLIVQQGIKVLQQKLASVVQELTGENDEVDQSTNYDPSTPGVGSQGDVLMDGGYTTPYGVGAGMGGVGGSGGGSGGASAWGGGTTPYGATPYGGASGWN
jgi:DNA-directed RNA polymerase II subunit RPB3